MRKSEIIVLSLILLSFIIGGYFYGVMPEQMASHWNAAGEVDGFMPKFWGLFLMPFIALGLLLLFILIPKIDPLKENIEKFRKYYDELVVLIILFLFYLYLLTIFWNLGLRFNMTLVLAPAFGLLFFYLGSIMKHMKRNWFVGIRTPWTLSSDKVWKKTHEIGGKLFMISGLIALLGVFFEAYAIWLMIGPVILSAIYLVVYSYFEFQKEAK